MSVESYKIVSLCVCVCAHTQHYVYTVCSEICKEFGHLKVARSKTAAPSHGNEQIKIVYVCYQQINKTLNGGAGAGWGRRWGSWLTYWACYHCDHCGWKLMHGQKQHVHLYRKFETFVYKSIDLYLKIPVCRQICVLNICKCTNLYPHPHTHLSEFSFWLVLNLFNSH